MEKEKITAEMIAPCGLDCALCKRALEKVNPCPGCLGPDTGTATNARIIPAVT